MKKILIPVDGSRGTKDIFAVCASIVRPAEEVILLHVEQLGGKTLMLDMLGEAEMSTLRESIQGTPFKERLDEVAGKILGHYRAKLEGLGARNIRTLVREGVPAEEILKVDISASPSMSTIRVFPPSCSTCSRITSSAGRTMPLNTVKMSFVPLVPSTGISIFFIILSFAVVPVKTVIRSPLSAPGCRDAPRPAPLPSRPGT